MKYFVASRLPSALPAAFAFLVAVAASSSASSSASAHRRPVDDVPDLFHPRRINFRYLASADKDGKAFATARDSLLESLRDVGLVALTDVPGYLSARRSTFPFVRDCALSSFDDDETFASSSKVAVGRTELDDGTERLTIASKIDVVPSSRSSSEDDDDVSSAGSASTALPKTKPCERFRAGSESLRSSTSIAIDAVARALDSIVRDDGEGRRRPLLPFDDDEEGGNGGGGFETLGDVVRSGEGLEHFRSYQAPPPLSPSAARDDSDFDSDVEDTVPFHTDQGLLVAFAPGRIVVDSGRGDDDTKETTTKLNDGSFRVELRDGSRPIAILREDDLIVMLGDGVERILADGRMDAKDGGSETPPLSLRAAPHSFRMPRNRFLKEEDEFVRVWYGRMVLPPPRALLPSPALDDSGPTIAAEALRDLLLRSADSGRDLPLGCASPARTARELAHPMMNCSDDQLLCWHACVDLAPLALSDDVCESRNLKLGCVHNETGEVWKMNHADDHYGPACYDPQSLQGRDDPTDDAFAVASSRLSWATASVAALAAAFWFV